MPIKLYLALLILGSSNRAEELGVTDFDY